MSILTANLTNRRAITPQWTTGRWSPQASSAASRSIPSLPACLSVISRPLIRTCTSFMRRGSGAVAGLSAAALSKATLPTARRIVHGHWISADGPEKVEPIIDWIRARVPRDANGNPVVDPNNPSRYFIVDEVNFSGSDESTTYSWIGRPPQPVGLRKIGWSARSARKRRSGELGTSPSTPQISTNAYSSIEAGGDATLKGSTLTNTGVSLFRTTTTTCHAQGACTAYNANGTANPSKNIANGSTIVSSVEAIGGVSANIKAGGALSVNFGSVNNTSAAGSMAGGRQRGGRQRSRRSVVGALRPDGRRRAVQRQFGLGAVAAPWPPPTKPKSGGFGGKIAHQTFLFETAQTYLDVGTFYGSGYFMDQSAISRRRRFPSSEMPISRTN